MEGEASAVAAEIRSDVPGELLAAFAPRLVFDSLEYLRPTTIGSFVGACRFLCQGAHSDLDPLGEAGLVDPRDATWRLDPLSDLEITDQPRSHELLLRHGTGENLDEAGTAYGRGVEDGTDARFLQYWMFYVDNPCVIDAGRHDGDWEFAQVRVERAGEGEPWRASGLTLNRHSTSETRPVSDGQERPTVYVAVNSHAAYFEPNTHPQFPLADECDGARAPQAPPQIVELPDAEGSWPAWGGEWGFDEGAGSWLERRLHFRLPAKLKGFLNHRVGAGDSPASPAVQLRSWDAAACYAAGRRQRALTPLARLAHFLGRLTWPRAPLGLNVERTADGDAEIRAAPSGLFLRRIRRISVMFENRASACPLGMVTVRMDDPNATFDVGSGADVVWRAAGYNWLRQRGGVIGPNELEPG